VCSIDGIAATISSTRGRRSKSLPPYRYPSVAISTFGSICLKRSTTVGVPNSGAQLDHTAPIDAHARKATTVSGTFGM
jgi:hypothetical protein